MRGCIEGGCSCRVTSKGGCSEGGRSGKEGCAERGCIQVEWSGGERVLVLETSRKVYVFTVEFCCNDCASQFIYLGFFVVIIIYF